jgi:hypothetical protein
MVHAVLLASLCGLSAVGSLCCSWLSGRSPASPCCAARFAVWSCHRRLLSCLPAFAFFLSLLSFFFLLLLLRSILFFDMASLFDESTAPAFRETARPVLMGLLLERQRLQEALLQAFVATLPPLVQLRHGECAPGADEEGWHSRGRRMADTTDYNELRCYVAPSKAIPGLCGVFAKQKFGFGATGIGSEKSGYVARYSGWLMLRSEFDAYQALYHHDMGVDVHSLFGRPVRRVHDDGDCIEEVVVAGSPSCTAAQINRPVQVAHGRKANCFLECKLGNITNDSNDSISVNTISIKTTKRIQIDEELLCSYAGGKWIDAACCFICSCAVEQTDLDVQSNGHALAIKCGGFINGHPCPFTVHRKCSFDKGVPKDQPYCHYCYNLSAGEDPEERLLVLKARDVPTLSGLAASEPVDHVISSNASFATVLKYAQQLSWLITSVHSCTGLTDGTLLVEFSCKSDSAAPQQLPAGSPYIRHFTVPASAVPLPAAMPAAVATTFSRESNRGDGIQPAHRTSSATGQLLAAPRKVLSDVLRQLSLTGADSFRTAAGVPAASTATLAAPVTALDSTIGFYADASAATGGALRNLASNLGVGGTTGRDWTLAAASAVLDHHLFREMKDWDQLQTLHNRYQVLSPITAVVIPGTQSDSVMSLNDFNDYIHALITKNTRSDNLVLAPCFSYRKTFYLVHCAGRAVVTSWLANVFHEHLHKINKAMRDAITELFSDARDLLIAQCADIRGSWDSSVQRCCDEWMAMDCATQRSRQEGELNVLVNHCSGLLGDHTDDDNVIDAPLVITFLKAHVQSLIERWRPLIEQHLGLSSPPYQCEGLVRTVMSDLLRRISFQLNNGESAVPHWNVGSLQMMMEGQQNAIIR